jgi:hypothetical protein
MATTITPKAKEIAKREGKVLFQIAINAKHLTPAQIKALGGKIFEGDFSASGAIDIKAARELWCWYLRLNKRKGF